MQAIATHSATQIQGVCFFPINGKAELRGGTWRNCFTVDIVLPSILGVLNYFLQFNLYDTE